MNAATPKPPTPAPARRDPMHSPAHERLWSGVPRRMRRTTQLAIVGAGLSGCAAAVAAARLGTEVLLVESTHMLGGQAGPAGVSAMDVTMAYAEQLNGYGLWGELHERVTRYYRYRLRRKVNVSQYRDTSLAPNPVVIDRVLTRMLHDAGVTVLRNVSVTEAEVKADAASLVTTSGPVEARLVIDASEDGHVLALAHVRCRVGNGIRDEQGQVAPKGALSSSIQDITQTAMIRRYGPGQVPPELLLDEPPEGYEGYRAQIVDGYPHGPGTARLEEPNGFAGYRAAPDLASENHYTGSQWRDVTRTSLNFNNDQGADARYLLDEGYRRTVERAAVNRTLSILWYLQHELGLDWAVATDEGFDRGPRPRDPEVWGGLPEAVVRHLPPIPYIRESLRLVGRSTMTGKGIYRRANRTDAAWDVTAVAVGTYPTDMHGPRSQRHLERDLQETLLDRPRVWREGPFPVPLGALIPEADIALLAAEKNISASRIAAAATRLHPTVTAIGEAAGTLAALAIARDVLPREVPSVVVQAAMALHGAHLAPHPVTGLDKSDPRFAFVQLALARCVVEPVETAATNPGPVRVDLDAAARCGEALVRHYHDWFSVSAPLVSALEATGLSVEQDPR